MGQSSSVEKVSAEGVSAGKKAKWELKRIVKEGDDGKSVEFYVMYGRCQIVIPAEDVDQDQTIKRFFDAAEKTGGGEANLFSVITKGENALTEKLYYYFESDFKNGIGTCLQEVATGGKNPHISNTLNMEEAQNLNDPNSLINFPSFEEKFSVSVLFVNDKSTGEESTTDIGKMHFYTLEDTDVEFVDPTKFSNDELELLQISLIFLIVAMLKAGIFDDKMKLKLYRKDNQPKGFLFLSNSKTISQECRNAYQGGNNIEQMFENVLKADSDVCSEEDKKLVFETKKRFDEIYDMLKKAKKPEPETY